MQPTWQTDDGSVRLFRANCLEILPTLEGVDAVVTDPPYGMNWNTDSTRFVGEHRSHQRARGKCPGRDWGGIASDGKCFDPRPWLNFSKVVLFGANHYGNLLPVGTTLVWLKKPDHLFGSFLSDAEIGWHKGGHGVYCFRKTFTARTRAKEAYGTAGYDRPPAHPTQKPVSLIKWAMDRAKVAATDMVLDPFMGSGTTGVACIKTGCKFIGIEIDVGYFQIAVKRIKRALAEQKEMLFPVVERQPMLPLAC